MNSSRRRTRWLTAAIIVIVVIAAYTLVVNWIDSNSNQKTGKAESSVVQPEVRRFLATPAGCRLSRTDIQPYAVNTQYAVKQTFTCSGVSASQLDSFARGAATHNGYTLNTAQGSGAGWGCNIASDQDHSCYDVIEADHGHVNARYIINVPAPSPLPSSPAATNLGSVDVSTYLLQLTYVD